MLDLWQIIKKEVEKAVLKMEQQMARFGLNK